MKKFLIGLFAALTLIIPAFAEASPAVPTQDAQTSAQPVQPPATSVKPRQAVRAKPNDAERSEMRFRLEQMTAKWETLSEKQKEKVYGIQSKIDKLQAELIKTYAELGILTHEDANRILERVENRTAKLKEKSSPPFMPLICKQ